MPRTTVLCLTVLLVCLIPSALLAAWPFNGRPMSDQGHRQGGPVSVPDGSGGVIVAWEDNRTTFFGTDVYIQRIDKHGNALWTPGGVQVTIGTAEEPFSSLWGIDMISDGAGGAFLVWDDESEANGEVDIQAQRFDATGNRLWVFAGVNVDNRAGDQVQPRVIGDGAGGIVVVWIDGTAAGGSDIYASRLDGNGVEQWGLGGVSVCTANGGQDRITVARSANRTLVAWRDNRATLSAYAQALDDTGAPQWLVNGLSVGTNSNVSGPLVFDDNAGGAMIVWQNLAGETPVVRRITAGGALAWPAQVASAFGTPPTIGSSWNAMTDGIGGVFVAFAAGDVFAQRVSASGNVLWQTDTNVSNDTMLGPDLPMAPDDSGGFVVAWRDGGVRAQRVSANGLNLWGPTGESVSTLTGNGAAIDGEIVADESGDAILTWGNVFVDLKDNVYSQRLESNYGAWGHPEPTISSVIDVPNDQGGEVLVNWFASDHDVVGIFGVDYYSVWRSITPIAGASPHSLALQSGPIVTPDQITKNFQGPAYTVSGDFLWEWVGNQDAFIFPGYSYTVQTYDNATTHYFQVVAHDFSEAFVSEPDSATSVDNLAPAPPFQLAAARVGGDNVDLDWSPSGVNEPDFSEYVVYRKDGTTTSTYELLTTSPDTMIVDSTASASSDYFYIVTARDINGNESDPTNEAMVGGTPTGIGDVVPSAASLQVRQNSPNPFSVSTSFNIGLPSAASVSVEVFDVAGRRVAARDLGRFAPGWQQVGFEARDATGRLLPSGVYFYRVIADGAVQTRKMVIQR